MLILLGSFVLLVWLTFMVVRRISWMFVRVWFEDGHYESYDRVTDIKVDGTRLTLTIDGKPRTLTNVRDFKSQLSRNQPSEGKQADRTVYTTSGGPRAQRMNDLVWSNSTEVFMTCIGECGYATKHSEHHYYNSGLVTRVCSVCGAASVWDVRTGELMRGPGGTGEERRRRHTDEHWEDQPGRPKGSKKGRKP